LSLPPVAVAVAVDLQEQQVRNAEAAVAVEPVVYLAYSSPRF
jgi:hypothetical protein